MSRGLDRKKARKLGRSSSSTRLSASFAEAGSGTPDVGGSIWQRPRTSSSTNSGSSSLSPWRTSKLEWQFQWRRLSRPKPSPSSLSVGGAAAPPPPKSAATPSSPPLSNGSPARKGQERCVGGEKKKDRKGAAPTMARNRSTPNLQVPPDLSMEELGKINAFYAPPPPALAVRALSAHVVPQRNPNRTLKLKPVLPVPKSADTKPLPVPSRSERRRNIPITLPLSPISSVGGCDSWGEGVPGEIYLTVDDVASGEAMLRLVESPM